MTADKVKAKDTTTAAASIAPPAEVPATPEAGAGEAVPTTTAAGSDATATPAAAAAAAPATTTTAPKATAVDKENDAATAAAVNSLAVVDQSGTAGEGEGGEPAEEMAVFITVHPPQTSALAAPLVLEPLAGMELVMQVRQLLAEIPQTCLYSAFRLVAVTPKERPGDGLKEDDDGGGGGGGGKDVWEGEGDVMNDFVELKSIPAVVARPEKVQVGHSLCNYFCPDVRSCVSWILDIGSGSWSGFWIWVFICTRVWVCICTRVRVLDPGLDLHLGLDLDLELDVGAAFAVGFGLGSGCGFGSLFATSLVGERGDLKCLDLIPVTTAAPAAVTPRVGSPRRSFCILVGAVFFVFFLSGERKKKVLGLML